MSSSFLIICYCLPPHLTVLLLSNENLFSSTFKSLINLIKGKKLHNWKQYLWWWFTPLSQLFGGRGKRISDFEANLVYRGNSRIASNTQKKPCLGKKCTHTHTPHSDSTLGLDLKWKMTTILSYHLQWNSVLVLSKWFKQLKMLACKPNDPNSIPKSHMVKGENWIFH